MTWTVKAAGHHNSSDWRAEEYEVLRKLLAAVSVDTTVTSSFEFYGNHVSATSVDDAQEKLAAYDAEVQADA